MDGEDFPAAQGPRVTRSGADYSPTSGISTSTISGASAQAAPSPLLRAAGTACNRMAYSLTRTPHTGRTFRLEIVHEHPHKLAPPLPAHPPRLRSAARRRPHPPRHRRRRRPLPRPRHSWQTRRPPLRNGHHHKSCRRHESLRHRPRSRHHLQPSPRPPRPHHRILSGRARRQLSWLGWRRGRTSPP